MKKKHSMWRKLSIWRRASPIMSTLFVCLTIGVIIFPFITHLPPSLRFLMSLLIMFPILMVIDFFVVKELKVMVLEGITEVRQAIKDKAAELEKASSTGQLLAVCHMCDKQIFIQSELSVADNDSCYCSHCFNGKG